MTSGAQPPVAATRALPVSSIVAGDLAPSVISAARPTATTDLRAAYAWQSVINANTGQRLRNLPLHQGSASVGWRFLPAAYANFGLRYRDMIENYGTGSAFLTADLRLSYDLTDAVTLHGRVENLFDRRYEEIYGHAAAGRSAYAGLSARF